MKRRLVIKSESERIVSGEVYSPYDVDTDNEAMTPEEIRSMAFRFLSEGRVHKIDTMHNQQESGAVVVESYIAKKGDPDGFDEGAWILTVHVSPDELWNSVQKGELNCFSFSGDSFSFELDTEVVVPVHAKGETELSLPEAPFPPHSHPIDLSFNENGRILPTATGDVLNHSHQVTKESATRSALGHSHRIILKEAENGGDN